MASETRHAGWLTSITKIPVALLFLCIGSLHAAVQVRLVCEHATLTIDCGNNVINLCSANYGRTVSTECGSSKGYHTNCKAKNSFQLMFNKCNGQMKCELQASNAVFGDPCQSTFKYLNASYCCEQKNPGMTQQCCKTSGFKVPTRKTEAVSVTTTQSTEFVTKQNVTTQTNVKTGNGRRRIIPYLVTTKEQTKAMQAVFTTATTSLTKTVSGGFHPAVWVASIITFALMCLVVALVLRHQKTKAQKEKAAKAPDLSAPVQHGGRAEQQNPDSCLYVCAQDNSGYLKDADIRTSSGSYSCQQDLSIQANADETATYSEINWNVKHLSPGTEVMMNSVYELGEEEEAAYVYRETQVNELYSSNG